MKLLSPSANKTAKDDQTLRNILRTQELEKAAAKARQSLAIAESEFNSVLSKNRQRWALEEDEHYKRVKEMSEEINTLENKRANALIPVKHLEEQAILRLKEAEEYNNKLKLKEERLDDLTDKLENKLDEAGKRLEDVKRSEISLNLRQNSLEQQAANTIAAVKDLNAKMAKFNVFEATEMTKLDSRKTDLVLIERSLIARDEQLKQKDKELAMLGIKLKDERVALNAAWAELKTKKLSP